MNPYRLFGRKAIVTGASGGIGAAIAHRFAAEGADVLLSYNENREGAEDAARQAMAMSRSRIIVRRCDVTNPADVRTFVDFAYDAFGVVDVLVNNAGYMNPCNVLRIDPTDWSRSLSVNVQGPIFFVQQLAPSMIRRRYGRIVNISSTTGPVGSQSSATYGMAKSALNSYTASLAKELGSHGITVNAIAASTIRTRMYMSLSDKRRIAVEHDTPVGRSGDPREIASLTAFLASDEAAFINGQIIVVDGGRVTWTRSEEAA